MFKPFKKLIRHIMGINIRKVMADQTKTVGDRVKIAILWQKGFDNPNPGSIADPKNTNMADYDFSHEDYLEITEHFNITIDTEKPGANPLNDADVEAFTTVQDCIDGVNDAIK